MIDEDRLARIMGGEALASQRQAAPTNLDLMNTEELLALRAEVERRLPALSLSDMDLEKELVIQFLKVKGVQETVLSPGSGTPANQMAQVSNTVAQTLQNLVSMQAKFHTAERLKEIESRLIKTLNKMPDEYTQEFFEWYEGSEL